MTGLSGSGSTGTDSGITVRRSLGRRLRALREAAGLTPADAPTVGSRQKIMRLEKAKSPFKSPDVRELCRIYGVGKEETDELAALAERTREDRIWDDYTDLLPGEFGTLVELEGVARTISAYQPDVMPGLLQTPDYARAVFEASSPPLSKVDIDRLVAVRIKRQEAILGGHSGAQIRAVLNEAVLARRVGGPDVAEAQLRHVRELAEGNRVSVRVLTWDAGAHPSMQGSFYLLEFADPVEPNVAYVESHAGARIMAKSAEFAHYSEIFTSLTKRSVSLKEYAP